MNAEVELIIVDIFVDGKYTKSVFKQLPIAVDRTVVIDNKILNVDKHNHCSVRIYR